MGAGAAQPRLWDVRTRRAAEIFGIVTATSVIAALSVFRLRQFRYPLDVRAALHGAAVTVGATAPAALGTWLLVALSIAALAGWLRRRDPTLSGSDAALGAVIVAWAGTYVTLLALGPLGIYRPWVLRVLVVAVVAMTLRPTPARLTPTPRWPAGAWIAVGAAVLSFVPLLLLQLGSPMSPFMDVLPYVASAEKIVTFRAYDAFDNDAAGLWGPTRQVAGCDGLFSFIALVLGIPAHLAITALIVPMSLLQIAAIYRLGAVVQGSLAGGMATLFLLQTFLWRRTPDVRGTALAFALVALGLAFLFARRRSGMRLALGGLALGLAITVNPLIGAIGMQLASAVLVARWLDLGGPLFAPIFALAGGSVFALPQVLIARALVVPALTLPLLALAGAAISAMVARRVAPVADARTLGAAAADPSLARESVPARWRGAWPFARVLMLLGLPVYMLREHARQGSEFFTPEWFGYAPLTFLGFAGLAVAAREIWRRPARWPVAFIPAAALWVGIFDFNFASPLRFTGTLEMRALASEVTPKVVSYWTPYWLALAAGVFFGMLARRWSRPWAVAVALLVVMYPIHYVPEPLDYDGQQLSLAETWGFHLTNAARGYWAGSFDRRWVIDRDWRELADVMRGEIAAGRIGYHTRVVHISPSINRVELALGSGVSVDLLTPSYNPESGWTIGGRVRGFDSLPAALAAKPPYVLVEDYPPSQYPQLGEYDEIMVRPHFHLYRRRDLGDGSAPAAAVQSGPSRQRRHTIPPANNAAPPANATAPDQPASAVTPANVAAPDQPAGGAPDQPPDGAADQVNSGDS